MEGLLDSKVLGGPSRGLALEMRKLTKSYGGTLAVDKLSLGIRRGGIYGLLGPNGAGKTTALKMVLGLIEPTSGSVRVLGYEPGSDGALSRVGAIIEHPGFYPYLTGRDNLRVVARYAGVPISRADEVLRQVGLSGKKARTAFKSYSLGMKQRLGVAAALLKNPELLILDEPTNGLDAKGMTEMRDLIRRLGEEERTVLLSSHLMWEVEQLCDRVGIIDEGKLIAEGAVIDLKQQGGFEVRAEPMERAAEVIAGVPGVGDVRATDDKFVVSADLDLAPEVVHDLAVSGVRVSEVRPAGLSLEDLFLELTEKNGRGN